MACDDCSAIYLRLALIMQNEEFLRELKRNEDFMRTLEFERGKNNSYFFLSTCAIIQYPMSVQRMKSSLWRKPTEQL